MLLELRNVRKVFERGTRSVEVLRRIDLNVRAGEFTAITGPSGSGKSTLLQIIGGLDQPSSGDVRIHDRSVLDLDDGELSRFRREELGFVFQLHHLISSLSAAENVSLPQLLCGSPPETAEQRANELLTLVGLGERASHFPNQLSGGEQQRVAIARALSNDPALILADEPTGNLDAAASREILGLLADAVRDRGHTVVMATHDPIAASFADRVLRLQDGLLVDAASGATGPLGEADGT
jgi:ABC-type lipoprotein export system ATPase subunit